MPNPNGKGLTAGNSKEKRGKSLAPRPPELFDGRALPILKGRARADFATRINVLAQIVDGELEQRVVQKRGDGGEMVTIYSPSANDRMRALAMLADYGQIPKGEGAGGGVGADPGTLTRALLAALSDPVVRRALATDPEIGPAIRLLTATPAPVVPGDDELNTVEVRVLGDEGDSLDSF